VALVGDASDNLPGTPGVGARTAAKWVQLYGNVTKLLEHVGELEPARLRSVIEAHADQLRQNERLATLRVDVPLGPAPHVTALQPQGLEALRQMFRQLEFKSLAARLDALATSADD